MAIVQGDAAYQLAAILHSQDWKRTRGVLFLDPYGLQCDWKMLKDIGATGALDLFFLVSVSGLYRQAANDMANVDADKAAALDRFLGTQDWRTVLYTARHDDLFGADPKLTREADTGALLHYVRERMAPHFGHVAQPQILNRRGAPLFGLIFAVANRHPKAIALAQRVARDIFSKVR